MAGPFAGFGGKPIIGKEGPNQHFVGRVVVELFEGPGIESDAHGLALIINPSLESTLSQHDLLKRIAAALPGRIVINEKANPPGYFQP
jgi:hypothetical protein